MEQHIPDLELLEQGWKVKRGKEGEPYFLYRQWPMMSWVSAEEARGEEKKQIGPTEEDIKRNPPDSWLLYRGWSAKVSPNPFGLYLYSRPGDNWMPVREARDADCTYGPRLGVGITSA